MTRRIKKVLKALNNTFWDFINDDCMSMAAAIAYYAVLSLPPLLVIVIMVASMAFSEEAARGEIREQIEFLIGSEGARQVEVMIRNASSLGSGGPFALAVGVIALLFGSTVAFAQLQYALNRTWQVEPDSEQGGIKSFFVKRLLSFGMILTVAFLLLVSLAVSAALSAFGKTLSHMLPSGLSEVFLQGVNVGLSLAVITLLFAAIFKVLPDARIAWKDVWIGAAVTSVLFVIGKHLIGLYLGKSDLASAYGAAGSLVIILVWVYYSSMILLIGAEFTQAWSRQQGRGIEPLEKAVRVVEAKEKVRDDGSKEVETKAKEPEPEEGELSEENDGKAGRKGGAVVESGEKEEKREGEKARGAGTARGS